MNLVHLVRSLDVSTTLLRPAFAITSKSDASPEQVDLYFDAGSGVHLPVQAVVVQPAGKAIIGGEFTTIENLPHFNGSAERGRAERRDVRGYRAHRGTEIKYRVRALTVLPVIRSIRALRPRRLRSGHKAKPNKLD